jgi:hypothetical protein
MCRPQGIGPCYNLEDLGTYCLPRCFWLQSNPLLDAEHSTAQGTSESLHLPCLRHVCWLPVYHLTITINLPPTRHPTAIVSFHTSNSISFHLDRYQQYRSDHKTLVRHSVTVETYVTAQTVRSRSSVTDRCMSDSAI